MLDAALVVFLTLRKMIEKGMGVLLSALWGSWGSMLLKGYKFLSWWYSRPFISAILFWTVDTSERARQEFKQHR